MLPPWLAEIRHMPSVRPVTVTPLTLQTDGEALVKTTARPEVAVAETMVLPPILSTAGVKLIEPIVWEPVGAATVTGVTTCTGGAT